MQLRMMVEETSTATGTGTLQLNGATTGKRRFFTAYGTNEFPYIIEMDDGSAWEWGIGVVNASHVLTRTLPMGSLSGSVPFNFGAGAKTVRSPLITAHGVAFRPTTSGNGGPSASGNSSLAVGGGAIASGAGSTAIGGTASGQNSVAIGPNGYGGGTYTAAGQESISILGLDASNFRSQAMCSGADAGHFVGMRAWNTTGISNRVQRVECELCAVTSDATPTDMTTAQFDNPSYPQVTANLRIWAVNVTVAATTDNGTLSYARNFRALLRRVSNTLSVVGSVTETAIGADGGFTGSCTLTVATQQLRMHVTGMAATTIIWGATVDIVQVL